MASVRCLEPGCAEEREKTVRRAAESKRRKAKKTFVSPSELLQIPLEPDTVKRYVALKHKAELESDKNTVYCPRKWCQGAARSRKHKKPRDLEFAEDSEDEPDEGDQAKAKDGPKVESLLAICEDCGFAFCSRCRHSWHGEFQYCMPKERKDEVTQEEKASMDYLKMYTTPCPTCAAPCQKTHGCNHMRCFRCRTHFCYLCSAWLNAENPYVDFPWNVACQSYDLTSSSRRISYQHFNVQPGGSINSCFMRLWELEGGDDGDVGIGHVGGDAMRNADAVAERLGPPHLELGGAAHDEVDDDTSEEADAEEAPAGAGGPPAEIGPPPAGAQVPQDRVAVAREGPLVLRIGADALPAPRARPPADARGEGRGGRGGDRALRGGRGRDIHRQNHDRGRDRNRNRAQAPGRQRGDEGARRGRNAAHVDLPQQQHGDQLDEAQEAWVRHFVALALHDEEHLMDWGLWDSDDEDV